MASLHKFSVLVTLISSILLINSFQSINAEDGDLITRICAGKLNYKTECIKYFRSNKQVVAAATTNKSLDLALAIMKNLVIPQAKTTHSVSLKKKQASPGVYGICEAEWAKAVPRLEKILEKITKSKGYINGDKFDLIKEANRVNKCGFSLLGKKVVDREIMEGEGNVIVALGAASRLLTGRFRE